MKLPRLTSVVAVVLWCCAPTAILAQAVVAPGATYLEAADGGATTSARWLRPDTEARSLRVSFANPPVDHVDFWDEARRALATWSGIPSAPFRFTLVGETTGAEIEFRWVDHFPTSQAGTTHRVLDARGHIERVIVVLARAHADGTPMGREYRRLVALHEVGHALGLPHSENPGDVMHPGNRRLDLSPRDVRSLRALYPRPGPQ